MDLFKKRSLIIGIFALIILTISGCGSDGSAPQRYQYHHYFPQSYFGGGVENSDTVALDEYDHSGRGGYTHSTFNDLSKWRSLLDSNQKEIGPLLATQNAFSKRKSALFLGRGVIDYCFVNYNFNGDKYVSGGLFRDKHSYRPTMKPMFLICMKYDSASNILYNVSYIFSIPAKLIHGVKVANGIDDYLKIVLHLAWGGILAVAMLAIGTVAGFLCHPFESFANFFVGTNFSSIDYSYHVNLVYYLVDLFWGAMISPLLDIFTLFK